VELIFGLPTSSFTKHLATTVADKLTDQYRQKQQNLRPNMVGHGPEFSSIHIIARQIYISSS
jgi:hypothetical protein